MFESNFTGNFSLLGCYLVFSLFYPDVDGVSLVNLVSLISRQLDFWHLGLLEEVRLHIGSKDGSQLFPLMNTLPCFHNCSVWLHVFVSLQLVPIDRGELAS